MTNLEKDALMQVLKDTEENNNKIINILTEFIKESHIENYDKGLLLASIAMSPKISKVLYKTIFECINELDEQENCYNCHRNNTDDGNYCRGEEEICHEFTENKFKGEC